MGDKILIDASVPILFGDILGGLLGAVIEAQAQAARSTVEFIAAVGTTDTSIEDGSVHELKSLLFKYFKNNETGNPEEFALKIPILSLVDIPSISVKTAKFSFYYDVKSTEDETSKIKPLPSAIKKSGGAPNTLEKHELFKRPVKILGKVNKETDTTSHIEKNAGIKVDIEIEKTPMTIGIDRMIDMLELAAKETRSEDLS